VIAIFGLLHFIENTKGTDRKALAAWIIFLALCPLVTLIHPYTYQAAFATLTVAGGNEAIPTLTEWQPFTAGNHKIHAIALLGLLVAQLGTGLRLPLGKAIFTVLLLFLFLSHVRFVYGFFLLVPVMISPDIAARFRPLSATAWRSSARDEIEKFVSAWNRPIAASVILLLAVLSIAFLAVLPMKPETPIFAAAEGIQYAKQRGFKGNVLNSYDFGGPLIYHDVKTYIDGRTDQLFLDGFTSIDKKTEHAGNEGMFTDTLVRHDIQWTLLNRKDPRILILDRLGGWRREYENQFVVIHLRQKTVE
jgi:hypothetical protein